MTVSCNPVAAGPKRTCMGCGRTTRKADLLRFVRRQDGTLFLDGEQREPGRGGYLCPREACFTAAFKKRRLSARFRREVREDLPSLLRRAGQRLLTDAAPAETPQAGRGPSRRGGAVSVGSGPVSGGA